MAQEFFNCPPPEEGAPPQDGRQPAARQEKAKLPGGELFEWLQMIMGCVLAAVVLFNCFARLTRVDGDSMDNTLQDGELMLVWSLGYTPKQGDIVICSLHENGYDENIIKRVIGVPGDVIDFQENDGYYELYVNGEKIEEPYIAEPMLSSGDWEYPLEVPEGSFFVLGDNRNASSDSRKETIGPVSKEDIMGKVILRLYPFDSFGLI